MKIPIYIDTDAGTDDALALIMALSDPRYEVVGISCVGGNVSLDHVTQNVLYLVEQMGKKVPVHVGAAGPEHRVLEKADFIHGKDGLGDIGLPLHDRVPASYDAVSHIIDMARTYDGELIVITLGPMTNLAKAIETDPQLPSLIRHCYIMGGNYRMPGNVTPVSEYNFWADPEAAHRCIHTDMDKTIVGWDVTLDQGYLTIEDLDDLSDYPSPLAKAAVDMQAIKLQWLQDHEQDVLCYLADPLAMAIALDESVATQMGEYYCDIVCSGDLEDTRGMLIVDVNGIKKKNPNARVIHAADHAAFKEKLFSSFS